MRCAPIFIIASVVGCSSTQDFQLPVVAKDDAGAASPKGPPADQGSIGCGGPSDSNNCGACGHTCLGGACAAGKCVPIVLASGQGDSASGVPWYPYTTDSGDPLAGPDRLAVDEVHVYWLNLRGEVMRVPISGGKAEHIATTKAAPSWIALADQTVFFSTLGGEIYRVPKAGGTPILFAPASARRGIMMLPGPYPLELRVAGDRLQWADGSGVYACPLAGCSGSPQTIDAGSADLRPFSFAVDASGKMYASEEGVSSGTASYAMTVFRKGQWLGVGGPTGYYELQGGESEVYALATTDFGPTGVVRWSESSVTFLASGNAIPGAARGLALDDDFAYWSNAAPNQIDRQKRTASVVRCAKTGCALPEVLADGQLVPRAVAVSKGAVYWTTGDGNVMKLAKPERLGTSHPLP